MKKHMIWGNRNLDLDDWRDDLLENYPELEGDESALYDLMYETNDSYLDDERVMEFEVEDKSWAYCRLTSGYEIICRMGKVY